MLCKIILTLLLMSRMAYATGAFPSGYLRDGGCENALMNDLDHALNVSSSRFAEAPLNVQVRNIHRIADLSYDRVTYLLAHGQFDYQKSILSEEQIELVLQRLKVLSRVKAKDLQPYASEMLQILIRLAQPLFNSWPLKTAGISDFKTLSYTALEADAKSAESNHDDRVDVYNMIFDAIVAGMDREPKRMKVVEEAARVLTLVAEEDDAGSKHGSTFEGFLTLLEIAHVHFQDFSGPELEALDDILLKLVQQLRPEYLKREDTFHGKRRLDRIVEILNLALAQPESAEFPQSTHGIEIKLKALTSLKELTSTAPQ